MDIELEQDVSDRLKTKTGEPLVVISEKSPKTVQDLVAGVASNKTLQDGAVVLTQAQLREAEEIADKLDLGDTNEIITFGIKAQEQLSKTAEQLIGHTRTKDAGEPVSEALTSLVGVVRGFPSKQFGGANNPVGWLVAKFVDPAQKMLDKFDRSAKQIDTIITTLDQQRGALAQDVQGLDNLFLDSVGQYKDLSVYVVAGKLRILKEREALDKEKEVDTKLADPLKMQERDEKNKRVEMLERKVNDLELTRTITLQTLPQIRMIQEVNKMLLQKIDGSIVTTVPVWKTQVAMSIAAYRQKQAIEVQNALADATNKLLVDNATLVKDNVVGGKKALERGVVDVETLETVSSTLISAVTESIEITKEARKRREETSEKLELLEGNLTKALSSGMQPQQQQLHPADLAERARLQDSK